MPLPKPPAKRAAQLSVVDFESQAAPKPGKRSPRVSAPAEPVPVATLKPAEARVVPAAAAAPTPHRPAVAERPEPKARAVKPRGTGPAKLFVLDTNVLMHDPMSLFRFDEHDVYLPMITLEELDDHKKGMTEVASSADHAAALVRGHGRRCALNHVMCEESAVVTEGAEVAFFPPITGG